jgi:glycosyltransferase involved in cell wall biosynthesis
MKITSMQTRIPAVSVCIPVYRGVAHLDAAIDSVLAQSFTDFELLIIDDNSPESIEAIVSRHQDPRIRFLRNSENLGAEGNWNRCLAEARGRYFKLLPMDDLIAHDCLEKQVAVLEQDAGRRIALVFCARSIIDADGRILMKRGIPCGKLGPMSGIKLLRRSLRHASNLIGEPGAVLFRKSLTDKAGLFDADVPYVIDLDYWCRLLRYGDAYYLPELLASFRVSRGSWSVRIGAGQSAEFRRFIAKCAGDPALQIRYCDVVAGNVFARLNAFLRLWLYRMAINEKIGVVS